MLNCKSLFICIVLLFFLHDGLTAGEYRKCRDTISRWISKTYAQDSLCLTDEREKLLRIMQSNKTDQEKIAEMKKVFSPAFQKKEEKLIYKSPLTIKVHSLALGYDIDDSASQIGKSSNILDEVNTGSSPSIGIVDRSIFISVLPDFCFVCWLVFTSSRILLLLPI